MKEVNPNTGNAGQPKDGPGRGGFDRPVSDSGSTIRSGSGPNGLDNLPGRLAVKHDASVFTSKG